MNGEEVNVAYTPDTAPRAFNWPVILGAIAAVVVGFAIWRNK